MYLADFVRIQFGYTYLRCRVCLTKGHPKVPYGTVIGTLPCYSYLHLLTLLRSLLLSYSIPYHLHQEVRYLTDTDTDTDTLPYLTYHHSIGIRKSNHEDDVVATTGTSLPSNNIYCN